MLPVRPHLTTAARVPLAGPTTLLGQYRHETDARLELLVRWYQTTSGSALDAVSVDLDRTTGWERIERSLPTSKEATHVRFYFRLYPPDDGEKRVANFDNIQLVEWTDSATSGGKDYDYLRVHESSTIEFTSSSQYHEAISWEALD